MKKYLLAISGALSVAVLGALVGSFAKAQTSTTVSNSAASSTLRNVPELRRLTITPKGRVGMSAVVTINNSNVSINPVAGSASSSRQIIVNSWGGDWTINIGATTTVRAQTTRAKIDPSEIMPGDRLEIAGQSFTDQNLTVDATVIRDRSIIHRTLSGKISNSNIGNGSFSLTSGANVINVVLPATGTPNVSGNGLSNFGDLQDGMSVRVTGDLNYSQATLFAKTIVVTNLNGVSTSTTSGNTSSPNTNTSAPTGVIPPLQTTSTPTPTASTTSVGTTTPTTIATSAAASSTPNTGTNSTTTATSTVPAANLNVLITGSGYNPPVITVQPGYSITWTNNDTSPHTVTANNGSFDSGLIQPGSTYTHTFSSNAVIGYHCTIHPTMQGTINVETGY